MSHLFEDCKSLKSIEIFEEKFITSKVTLMNNMFSNCESLSEISIKFDTKLVQDMSNIFRYCKSLQNMDLKNLDISSVKNISHMLVDVIIYLK